jgi:hypothetical protein
MSMGVQKRKTGPAALGTAENESGRVKQEQGKRRPRYRRKRVREHKTLKRDPTSSVPPKTSSAAQNKKKGPYALGTAENEFGSAKQEKGPYALGTAENESGSKKHENGTRRPWYRRKLVRERKTRKRDPTPLVPPKTSKGAQNIETGPDALGIVENDSKPTVFRQI